MPPKTAEFLEYFEYFTVKSTPVDNNVPTSLWGSTDKSSSASFVALIQPPHGELEDTLGSP